MPVLRQRHHSALCAVAVAEEVPELDPVAGRVEEVDRAVAAGVLDRPLDLDPALEQAGHQGVEPIMVDGEGEVDVAAATVGVLLLAGGPDAEPAALAHRQPDALV